MKQVTLKNALGSFAELAETEDYHWPFALLLPDVLTRLDLPDLVRELQSKQLSNIAPWGPNDGKA